MTDVLLRRGTPADLELVIAVWRAAQTARRDNRPAQAEHEGRVRGYLHKPDAFLLVAEDAGEVVGMGLGMQGLADDGAGPPLPRLCHIAMIFVAPERWGEGIGGRVVDSMLKEARSRGYERAQRLYEGHGFRRTSREAEDDFGEWITHYERAL